MKLVTCELCNLPLLLSDLSPVANRMIDMHAHTHFPYRDVEAYDE